MGRAVTPAPADPVAPAPGARGGQPPPEPRPPHKMLPVLEGARRGGGPRGEGPPGAYHYARPAGRARGVERKARKAERQGSAKATLNATASAPNSAPPASRQGARQAGLGARAANGGRATTCKAQPGARLPKAIPSFCLFRGFSWVVVREMFLLYKFNIDRLFFSSFFFTEQAPRVCGGL